MEENRLLTNKVSTIQDKFWFEDPRIIINTKRLTEFFPSRNMVLTEQLNAIVRLSLYVSIVLLFYSGNFNYSYIFIFTLLFTYIIYYYSNKNIEKFSNLTKINDILYDKENLVVPTQNNPFMNVLHTDYIDNPDREAIIKLNNYDNNKLKDEIEEKFGYNLYRDLDDVYNKFSSQRQFYTAPVTTIPNEQGRFADWCYKTSYTCKEGNGNQCVANNYYPLKDSQYRNPFYS